MGTMTASLLLLSSIKMNIDLPGAFPKYNSLPGCVSVTKRSWVVKTESNVWKEEIETPMPPCVGCKGRGKVNCFYCRGRGRTNYSHLAVLPKGEWPKWCKKCRGSGLGCCSRCLGTGIYQKSFGSQLFRKNDWDENDQKKDP